MVVVTDFIQSPTLDKLLKLKKEDLLAVGNELNIEVKRSMRKAQIVRSIAKELIDCEDYPEDFNESVWEKLPLDSVEMSDRQFELEKLRLDKLAQIEIEKAKIAADAQAQAQAQAANIEKAKIEAETRRMELQFRHDSDENRRNAFDLTKYVKLVPQFNESDVDKYFQHFEKIAKNLHWPENVWSTLLQSALKGKAQETFAALSVDDSSDYDVVKSAILKAYELVPEAYRQKFRNYKKDDKQTYVEFANQTEVYFDRWCSAKKVISDYDKLRQIVLIEQFKRCVHDDLKTYLDEKNVETLHEMAVLADDYALTHKRSFKPRQGGYSKPSGGSGGFGDSGSGGSSSSGSSSIQTPTGVSHGSNAGNKPSDDSHSSGASGGSSGSKSAPSSSRFKCFYCEKPGHVMSNCWRKMADESTASPDVKPQGFVSSVKPDDRTPVVEEITDHFDPKFDVREEYKPFVSVGSVSLVDSISTSVPVKILRDTGATQTLMSKHTLPFGTSSATGKSIVIQGIDGGFKKVPLHLVNLVSDVVSGSVVVGVLNTLPVKGVSMLLGNDLAGGKVIAEPDVVMEPVTSAENDKFEEEISNVIPSCGVTQAQASTMAKDTRASIKWKDIRERDQDPSNNNDGKRDRDRYRGPNRSKWHFRSEGDWRNRRKTSTDRQGRSNNDRRDDRRDGGRWRNGTPNGKPYNDVGRRQNDACDDRGPRREFCDDDRGSQRDSGDRHVPVNRPDQCHRMLEEKHFEEEEGKEKMHKLDEIEVEEYEIEGQIEHNCHEEIDRMKEGQSAANAHDEERTKPETPDWCHETTEAVDVDHQKAFDSTVRDLASMLISKDDDATPGHWFGKLGFLSSCLGYALFLNNIWRYLCYRNDNGISLISYVLILFFSGILLFIMEFGQFASKIVSCVWKLNSFYQEILLVMFISSFLVTMDYNTLIVWSFISVFTLLDRQFPRQKIHSDFNMPAYSLFDTLEMKSCTGHSNRYLNHTCFMIAKNDLDKYNLECQAGNGC